MRHLLKKQVVKLSYIDSEKIKNFVTALQYCKYLNGTMAVIIDEHNQKAIEMFLETADPTGTGSFWIGLTDMFHEANFEWTTREPLTYTNWYEPNPDNWEKNEHFTRI